MLIAKKILDAFLECYGSETAYLQTEGEILSQEETEEFFTNYLNKLEIAED